MIYEILVLLIAGLGAGAITGFVGASAVVIAAPILILFLNIDAYVAIGLSLTIDIFASLFAATIYFKNKRIRIKKSLIILIPALVFTLVGSYFSQFVSSGSLVGITGFAIMVDGIIFFAKGNKKITKKKSSEYPLFYSLLAGIIIGLIAGIFGAGGGLMISLALLLLLNYSVHEAIGTSIVFMIFIALFGGVAHFIIQPFPISFLIWGALGGILGAFYSAKIANYMDEKLIAKLIGVVLFILGTSVFLREVIF